MIDAFVIRIAVESGRRAMSGAVEGIIRPVDRRPDQSIKLPRRPWLAGADEWKGIIEIRVVFHSVRGVRWRTSVTE